MKNYIKNNLEAIKDYIDNLDDDEQIRLHNEFCQSHGNGDDEIYDNDDDFFNTFFDNRTIEAVRAVCYGEYNYTDSYVKFNGYANLVSFNNPENEIDITEIAEDILDNPGNYYDIELEEEEEEEEEE